MEGVAFSLREAIDIFRELGAPINEIRLGGGGARSQLWRQIQADVYGQTVSTIAADEGAAFGAAILAGVVSYVALVLLTRAVTWDELRALVHKSVDDDTAVVAAPPSRPAHARG